MSDCRQPGRVLRIGELYDPDCWAYREGERFIWTTSGAEITLFRRTPGQADVQPFGEGPVRIGSRMVRRIIFIAYDIAGVGPGVAPYNWHLTPQECRILPDPTADPGPLPLRMVLVDAATGRVVALRPLTLSPRVTQQLLVRVNKQANHLFNQGTYDQALADIRARHSTMDLAMRATMDPAA